MASKRWEFEANERLNSSNRIWHIKWENQLQEENIDAFHGKRKTVGLNKGVCCNKRVAKRYSQVYEDS